MLNFEKYKDEIENYDVQKGALDCYLCKLRKGHCDDYDDNCDKCLKESFKFLFSEYREPIKLTLHEKCILESIDKKNKFIARDRDNGLWIYESKPLKSNICWNNEEYMQYINIFNHLFKFIKWEDEEPYNIQDILNNCEVIKDD